MSYRQVTERERYYISGALREGRSKAFIARALGRPRSTIQREILRNKDRRGHYKALIAHDKALFRRKDSRRKSYFTEAEWALVFARIRLEWAPEQAAGRLAQAGLVKMHFGTIYREIKRDKRKGGRLFRHLRQAQRQRRKRYGRPDSRGRLRGKRNISSRPLEATLRLVLGHWEGDLVRGYRGQGWILTLIERKSRYCRILKLGNKSVREVNRKLIRVLKSHAVKTVTVDNGCEFHGYKEVEAATGALFYFANPHRSWERGSVENLNGLIRQYLPKTMSLENLTQSRCAFIEIRLNQRPRKLLNYKTPEECYFGL
jgi:transposase, IS30 family